MTTVDIETLLGHDDLRSLIEACEQTGAIKAPEVHEIVEASVEFAKAGTDPKPEDALKNIYA